MAFASLFCGTAAGCTAAVLWLFTGGSLMGALASYALAGQIVTLSLLWLHLRRQNAE